MENQNSPSERSRWWHRPVRQSARGTNRMGKRPLMLQPIPGQSISRRAFFLMPVAAAAIVASLYRRVRKMPDATAAGSGAEVDIVDFTDRGERTETHHVRQIVKSDTEWRQ